MFVIYWLLPSGDWWFALAATGSAVVGVLFDKVRDRRRRRDLRR
jgi:hypothetical protein